MLGGQGAGLRVFATAMQWERSCLLSGFLGAAERDLEACLSLLRASPFLVQARLLASVDEDIGSIRLMRC